MTIQEHPGVLMSLADPPPRPPARREFPIAGDWATLGITLAWSAVLAAVGLVSGLFGAWGAATVLASAMVPAWLSAVRGRRAGRREDRFRLLAESGVLGVIRADFQGRIFEVNDEFLRIIGYSRQDFHARPIRWTDLTPPECLPADDRGIVEAKARRMCTPYAKQYIRKDGSRVHVVVGYALLPRSSEQVIAFVLDITEKTRAEDALRESEIRYRTLTEGVPQLVWTCLPDGRCEYLSPQWCSFTGLPEADQLDFRWLDLVIHPDDRPRTLECWMNAVAGLAPYDIQYRIRRHDGEYRWFQTRGIPIRDASGQIVRWFGSCTDIDDQIQAEEAARHTAEHLGFALKTARMGSWEVDLPRSTLECSEEFKANFGREPAEPFTLDDMFRSIHPQDLGRVRDEMDAAVVRRSDYEAEYRAIWPDGSTHWVLARGQPFYGPQGTPQKLVGLTLDITDRKRAEEALREADHRKDEFLAMLAHELRNPLAAIHGALTLAAEDGSEEEREWVSSVVDRQVGHLSRLIDDLLDVSRISRGKIGLRPEPLDLKVIVALAAEAVRPLMKARRHEFLIDLDPGALTLVGDRTRLEQVLVNLLSNAAKYTDDGGRIRLSARQESGEIRIRVEDDGVGISPEMQPKVFDLFTQVDPSLDRAQGGLGIGLTLVKTLVEMHGGRVSVKSEPGLGTEFLVSLQAASDASKVEGPPAVPEDRGSSGSIRVLVVDDNVDSARAMARLLARRGHDVRTAFDGPSALDEARDFNPEVIFLDIGLPGMDGYQVARRLRDDQATRSARIIAVSGYGQERDRDRSALAGFDHHLIKPVEYEAVFRLLDPVTSRG